MNPYDIIFHFYPQDTPLRRLLLLHSEKVRDKALSILAEARLKDPERFASVDESLVNAGALLHDIGIGRTHAPSILCEGTENYICHGTIGAEMLRALSLETESASVFTPSQAALDTKHMAWDKQFIESLARICERHTGSGLTREDIVSQGLPIEPARDLLPETLEEQLVCLADKFYSKSGDLAREKDFERVKRSMMKFGAASMARFEALCDTFYLK